MKIVKEVFYTDLGGEQFLKAARVEDDITKEEKLVGPSELTDPNTVDVGDDAAYKVSLFERDPEDGPSLMNLKTEKFRPMK